MVLASGRQGVISDPLHAKLIPDGDEVVALVELDLVGHEPTAVFLIGGVLQVPITLLLLDEPPERLLVLLGNTILNDAPDL